MPSTSSAVTPALCLGLRNHAADPATGWRHVLDRALAAEESGVERVMVSEHVVFGENLEAYANPATGGRAGGTQPTGPDGLWLDPLTLLAMVAGITSRVRLGTGILLAALRRPVILAKTASTLDVISDGRLDLGVGIGWQREEYDAAGLSFEGRGRLLDHTLEVCEALWTQPVAGYRSPELEFDHIHMMPKPVQPGGVPIWVSGTMNDKVLARLVRFAHGWMPWGDSFEDPSPDIARLREALSAAGRDPKTFPVMGSLPLVLDSDGGYDIDRSLERVPDLVAAGVTDFRITAPVPDERNAAIDVLSDLVGRFAVASGRSS